MFPRFDNLIPGQLDQLASDLGHDGWTQPRVAAGYLIELRRLWEAGGGSAESSREWYAVLRRVLQDARGSALTLGAVCEFVRATQCASDAFALFTNSPRSLEILGRFASGSSFLTQVLLRDSDSLSFLTEHRRVSELKSREDFCAEAKRFLENEARPALTALRLYQRREQLRIGMCDVFGLLNLQHITLQLSLLADAMVSLCLKLALEAGGVTEPPFAVLALGKHGGEELNYSSDIDLVMVGESQDRRAQSFARHMVEGLNEHLETGFLYRVDLRLRPWGNAGPLVTKPDSWFEYLSDHAQLWEKQALLKARFVAGDPAVAERMLMKFPGLLFTESADSIRSGIRLMKDRLESRLRLTNRNETEVKLGSGSIRDIEFVVQSLQLIHGATEPRVASANTLDALVRLADFGVLPAGDFQQLRDGYVFLRSIEHALQLQHNRQTHEIPRQPELREWLALRVDYPNAAAFMNRFDEHRRAVRRVFDSHFRPASPRQTGSDASDTSHQLDATSPSRLNSAELRAGAALQKLSKDVAGSQLVAVDLLEVDARRAVLLICTPDAPELLTLISGVLFSAGLDIRQGTVATGPDPLSDLELPVGIFGAQLQIESLSPAVLQHERCRLIHDRIESLVLTSHRQGLEAVREELIAQFCLRMAENRRDNPVLSDLQIVDRPAADHSATVVTISSADNPGFLFELSNALNLWGFRIRRARIDAEHDQVRDELWITESDREVPLTQSRIQEVHTAVTLIQKFTLWLPTSADPGRVLLRFRRLLQTLLRDSVHAENALALRNPDVLSRAARVLGLSRHLWEDALQHESHLIPFLAAPDTLSCPIDGATLRQELLSALETASESNEACSKVDVLNQFKDRQLFRIELRHVLGHCRAFGDFSREITALAEVGLEMAVHIAWNELSERYGSSAQVPECRWSLVGLGKFGGVEMGYASDVELLLIYDSPGDHLVGRWFERLLTRATEILASRRDGIFEIDLRMRPWGQAGSPAVSIEQFETYYSRTGSAWPYERQSLIKLRSFGADVGLGRRVMDVRDRVVYDGRPVDFAAMNGLREQQVRQHVQPGTIHAKLSEGCLVDIEYSIQALQLIFGRQHISLRTANTQDALHAAHSAALLTDELREMSDAAYVYFRQLIDCLRMVRGNAKDLKIPREGSDDWDQLNWRLAQIYSVHVSLAGLAHHRAAVCQLIAQVRVLCGQSDGTVMGHG
ncbi:MAG: hypothetical protein ABGZ35_27805 [Planctomycetaceae bacterium]